jgi:hypothetical protein
MKDLKASTLSERARVLIVLSEEKGVWIAGLDSDSWAIASVRADHPIVRDWLQ